MRNVDGLLFEELPPGRRPCLECVDVTSRNDHEHQYLCSITCPKRARDAEVAELRAVLQEVVDHPYGQSGPWLALRKRIRAALGVAKP